MVVLDVLRAGDGFRVVFAHHGEVYIGPLDRVPAEAVRAWLDQQERGDGLGALGGVVEELQAAARPTVTEWVQTLGTLAVKAAGHRDRFRALERGVALVPALPLVRGLVADMRRQLTTEADRADARRRDLLTVRDWVYETAGYAVDLDTGDASGAGTRADHRGAAAGLGAVQLGAGVVVSILGGLTLAGYIAWQVRVHADTEELVASYERLADKLAQAKTPQERDAYGQALHELGKGVQTRAAQGGGDFGDVGKVLAWGAAIIAGAWGVSRLLRFRDARAGERR